MLIIELTHISIVQQVVAWRNGIKMSGLGNSPNNNFGIGDLILKCFARVYVVDDISKMAKIVATGDN